MVAILTGDIMHSARTPVPQWMDPLRSLMGRWGKNPGDWDIYRGDELQMRLPPGEALFAAIRLKAMMRSEADLDIRLAIGIGNEDFRGKRVSESNGPAYHRSGHAFERLRKEKVRMLVAGGEESADRGFNLMLKLASQIMDNWSRVSAEAVGLALDNPEASQEQLANQLNIKQSAISQRHSRARLDLVRELLSYYKDVYLIQIGCYS